MDLTDCKVSDSKVSDGNPFASYELVEEEIVEERPIPSRLKVVKKTGVKEPKRITQEISFELFLKEDKTIEEIAVERGLKSNTILEHILKYLPHKDIPITRLMSESTYNEIKAAYDVAGPETSMKFIKDSLRHSISYTEIKMCNKILFCTEVSDTNMNNLDTVKRVRL